MNSVTSRFAVARLHLPTGATLKNQIVEVSVHAGLLHYRYFPLTEELAFTEWRGGDFFIEEESRTLPLPAGCTPSDIGRLREQTGRTAGNGDRSVASHQTDRTEPA